jgi:hypothetical protein
MRAHRPRTLLFVAFTAALTLSPRRAPATVEEQRARLPPPAQCPDPVQGVWRSHAFNEMWGEWNIFTLRVERVPGSESELKGIITNEAWYGPATESVRGPCESRLQYLVSMDAQGTIVDDKIAFGGIGTWRLDQLFCGTADFGYNLDRFAGTIDLELLEFQSVNNDGGSAVNEPTVFRRIACFDDQPKKPEGDVKPPPFYPKRRASSGGC